MTAALLARALAACCALHAPAAGAPAAGAPAAVPAQAGGATWLVVVVGAAGEPQYGAAFHAAALALTDAARTRFGLPDSAVVYLGDDPARAPGRIAARSTRENVERALGGLAARARPGDQVWVVLIGHGSGQGDSSRFNLPGPDLTAADFARLLAGLGRQRVAFVNTASASGDFVKALAAPNRAVVTATKSALERNETRFARYFAEAFGGTAGGADVDKDGRVSLLEAFGYARRGVARAYESENLLLTEHAQLDDDGDGVASAEPTATGRDGSLAAALALGGGTASTDPRVVALVGEQRALEARIAALRQRKPGMDAAAYDAQLEALLLDLARKAAEVRAAEGRRP